MLSLYVTVGAFMAVVRGQMEFFVRETSRSLVFNFSP